MGLRFIKNGSPADVSAANPLPVTTSGGEVVAYTHVTDTTAAIGDNTLIAAPGAGTRIVVKDLVVQNESETSTTAILKSGDTDQWRGLLAAGESLSMSFAAGDEWRLGENEALILNLDGANSHGYSVRYYTEAA